MGGDLERGDRNEIGRRAQQVAALARVGLVGEPHHPRIEALHRLRRTLRRGEHGAARDVEIGVELQHDRLAGARALEVAPHGHDAPHPGAPAAERIDHLAAARNLSGCHRPGQTAKVRPGANHRLHGEAELVAAFQLACRRGAEVLQKRRALVPGHHRLGAMRNVVSEHRRDRDGDCLCEPEPLHQGLEVALDGAEARLRPVGQVHLVDGENDALDAHQIEDGGMAPGLDLDPGAGIDEQDRDIGVRGAGRHVARVLLVARGVDDDEAARRRVEVAPGDVDGDALLALGDQTVEQQAEIERSRRRALCLLEHQLLVGVHGAGVDEHAADQGGLAVVDGAAGEHVQRLGARRLGLGGGGTRGRNPVQHRRRAALPDLADLGQRVHQKYPSCFLRSMAPASSWSMSRPWRSDTWADRVSSMTA